RSPSRAARSPARGRSTRGCPRRPSLRGGCAARRALRPRGSSRHSTPSLLVEGGVEGSCELHRPADEEEAEEEDGRDAEDAVRLLALREPGEEDERVEEADRGDAEPDDERAWRQVARPVRLVREQEPGEQEPEDREPERVDEEVDDCVDREVERAPDGRRRGRDAEEGHEPREEQQ